jgi:adenylate kinase family enzyme
MDCLIFLKCSENVMRERLLRRSQTSGRTDDHEEAIKERIRVFNRETLPVVEWFKLERNNVIEVRLFLFAFFTT